MPFDELGVFQGDFQGVVELFEHGRWRAFGCVQTVPDGQVETPHAHFIEGRVIFEELVAAQGLGGGDRESFDAARFDLTGGVGGLVAHHIDLAAHQGVHGRGRAAKGNGRHGFRGLKARLPHQPAEVRG